MHKASLKNFICATTLFSFAFSVLPQPAAAYNLAPESFGEMYRLARIGDVESLRAAVYRGLNIDSVNADGDTGLCIAAKRHDVYAYNAFRAAGANPNHPCVQNISDYEDFVNSSRTVPTTATSRSAYSKMGKEVYSISPKVWWWVGGIALAGGATAIALGAGGGGGGSKKKKEDPVDPVDPTEPAYSLGALAGKSATIKKSTTGQVINKTDITSKNGHTQKIADIKLNSDVLHNTKYLDVVLKAHKGGYYINDTDTVLKISDGVAAMVAVDKSYVTNRGYINNTSSNASIGMIASENSVATNSGAGIILQNSSSNGIGLNFSGKNDTDTVIGMYADTNSTLINNGDIKGTAIEASESSTDTQSTEQTNNASAGVSANVGSIIGMEAMIINVGKKLNENTSRLINMTNGKISLSSGDGGTETTIKTNLIGMASFLNNNFLNGSYDINRAENVSLTNNGEISLSYSGEYIPSSQDTLRKGTGGIIGIRADANSTAVNNANIYITLNENNSGSNIDATAGMQSVHLADLTNNGNISIVTSAGNQRINYGMMSVEGSGTVSGLYSNPNKKQTLNNEGIINIQASNSYGIASFNGGVINNTNVITLGKPNTTTQYSNNIGIYGYGKTLQTQISNTGTINVFSYDSFAMVNDFAGATELKNNGIINIYDSAANSNVFGGSYSVAGNEASINYYITKTGTATEPGTADDPFSNYQPNIQQSVITSRSPTSSSSSSSTERIYNAQNATINIFGSSFTSGLSLQTEQAKAENKGVINLNAYTYDTESDSVAMYAYADANNFSTLLNSGEINTNSYMSAAMASDSAYNAAVINSGTINTQKDYSLGLYASQKSVLTNEQSGTINIKGSNSVAIYTNGNSNITNKGTITMGTIPLPLTNSFAIFSKGSSNTITNTGIINFHANSLPTSTSMFIYSSGDNTKIQNSGTMTMYGTVSDSKTYGIYAGGENNRIVNEGNIVGVQYGIFSSGSNVNIVNQHKIEVVAGAGIHTTGTNAIIVNNSNIKASSGKGIMVENSADITNNGTINSYSDGIYASEGGVSITNNGTIKSSAIGISAVADSSVGAPTTITNSAAATIDTTTGTHGIYVVVKDSQATLTIRNDGAINAADYPIFIYREYQLPNPVPADFEANISVIGTHPEHHDEYLPNNNLTSTGLVRPRLTMLNNGLLRSSSPINFDSNDDISYAIGRNGVYEAPELSGTIIATSDLVTEGFESSYVSENAFIGENLGLNVLSDSYLFTASLQSSGLQSNNLVMTMQSFDKVVDNKKTASYLKLNYKNHNNEEFFNLLKTAAYKKQFDSYLNRELAANILPNMIFQTLQTERTLSALVNDDLISPLDNNDRLRFNFTAYQNQAGAKKELSGYKDKVLSAYTFKDSQVGTHSRFGFGLSATRVDSDYKQNATRYNNSLQFFIPVTFGNNSLAALIKPKAGFERGHYRRHDVTDHHKANTQNYIYGFDSLAKKSFDAKFITIEPSIGFNLTGLYAKGIKESGKGIKTKDENIVSAQSLIGLELAKKFNINSQNSLTLSTGGRYFHEFGKKPRLSATLKDCDGYYDLVDKRRQKDFGIVDLRAVYEYKKLSASTSFVLPIEQKQNPYFMFNLGYNF